MSGIYSDLVSIRATNYFSHSHHVSEPVLDIGCSLMGNTEEFPPTNGSIGT